MENHRLIFWVLCRKLIELYCLSETLLFKRNFIVSGQGQQICSSWCPDLPLVDNVFDCPASFIEFPWNPFPVAFPWKTLCADDDRGLCLRYGFQFIDPIRKCLCNGVSDVSAFSESSELWPEEVVFNTFTFEEGLEIFTSENGDSTPRKATHVDDRSNIIGKEDFNKVLFSPPVCPQCVDNFQGFADNYITVGDLSNLSSWR